RRGGARTPPATAAPTLAPPPSISTPRPRRAVANESSGHGKIIAISVIAVVLVIGAIVGLKMFGGKPKVPMKGNDAAIVEQLNDENGTEARKWLGQNPSRMVMGLSRKQAEYRVDELYRMGAKQVMCMGGVVSTTLAVELPTDPAKRKELFDWAKKWHNEMGEKADVDVGQNWLMIKM